MVYIRKKNYEVDFSKFQTPASKAGYERILKAVSESKIDRNNPNAFPEKAGAIIQGAILKGKKDAQEIADKLQEEWEFGMYE